jgi:NO-binding membrane sensor protein with MHYT domain
MVVLDVQIQANDVLVALGLMYTGTLAAVSLCEQYRLASTSASKSKYFVLLLVACALGWGGTWSMHAASIASMKLYHEGVEVPVRYNSAILFLAGIQSVVQTLVGLYVSSTDDCFNKTGKEIMEKFIARTSANFTIKDIKKMNKLKILFTVLTHSLDRLNFGGVFGGIGVVATHYIMMQSVEFHGTIEYNPGIVVASFICGMIASHGGYWAFFRVLSLFPSLDILRNILAIVGVIAVGGAHYIAMSAATFRYHPDEMRKAPPTNSATISPTNLYYGAVVSSIIFLVVMMMYVLHDLRSWLLRTSAQLRQADKALALLMRRRARGSGKHTPLPLEVTQYAARFLEGQISDASISLSMTQSTRVSDSARSEPVATDAGDNVVASKKKHLARALSVHGLYNDYSEEDHDGDSSDDGSSSNSRSYSQHGGRGATNRAAPRSSRTLDNNVTRTEVFNKESNDSSWEACEKGNSIQEEMEMHEVHSVHDDHGDEEEGPGEKYVVSAGSSRTASYSVNIKQGGSFFGGLKAASIVPVASEEFRENPTVARERSGKEPGQRLAATEADMA